MMYSCDVNVIFNFKEGRFSEKVDRYLKKIGNSNFILLHSVRENFEYTYHRRLEWIRAEVISAINQSKNAFQKKSSSATIREKMQPFNTKLNKCVEENRDLIKNKRFAIEYGLLFFEESGGLDVYNNQKTICDNTALSKKLTNKQLEAFMKEIKNKEESCRFPDEELEKIEDKINKMKEYKYIFIEDSGRADGEDIAVACDYFCYLKHKNKEVEFSSFDRKMILSMNEFKNEYEFDCPNAVCLL